jgi:phosphatidylglycerophosphate synthase
LHRIARVGVRPLVGTRATPNHLTTARLACGLAAAGAFAAGTDGWTLAGAAIFILAMLLDRADGELARLSGATSPGGHLYDLLADGMSNAAAFIGIGIGLSQAGGVFGPVALPLGIVAGLAAAFAEILVIRMDALGIHPTHELGGVRGFDPDDAMVIVPVAVAVGLGGPLLVAAAVGGPGVLAFFTWKAMQGRPGD